MIEDVFWRYTILYIVPMLGLLAASAPDIQLYPKLVAIAEYRPRERVFAFTWMTLSVLIVFPIQYLLLNKGQWFILSDAIWVIIYIIFAWKVGPYLGQ